MSEALSIVVYSDVVCPWCYVGKRRLEAALVAADMPQVNLLWRPFELNPQLPAEGIDRDVYRAAKFGAGRGAALDARMAETGNACGIAFAFERILRTPNTRLAHRLIWEADRQSRQDAVVERLFQGYFEQGRDIGARRVLEDIAAEAGMEAVGARRALSEDASLAAVMDLEFEGRRRGIEGVPFFVLPGEFAVSGAQPPEFWQRMLPRVGFAARSAHS
jgi:predicted DsbA family dithiol-disulfide isomerase